MGSHKRVLLAEDEPNIVELLTFVLERSGYSVESRADGQAALETALREPPDVMILDVMLPSTDGMDVLRRLRAETAARRVPVIMLSAKSQREDRERALCCGADLYITKPFSNAEVVAAVARLAEVQHA